jgi:hypothetical protein
MCPAVGRIRPKTAGTSFRPLRVSRPSHTHRFADDRLCPLIDPSVGGLAAKYVRLREAVRAGNLAAVADLLFIAAAVSANVKAARMLSDANPSVHVAKVQENP